MKKNRNWPLFIIVMLVLTSLACRTLLGDQDETGGDSVSGEPPVALTVDIGSGVEDPAGSVDEPPTEDTTVPPTVEPPAAATTVNLDEPGLYSGITEFKGVQINMTLVFEETDGDGSNAGRIVIDGLRVVDPPSLNLNFTIEGDQPAAIADGFSLVETEGTGYFVLPDGNCISSDAGDMTGSLDELLEIEGLLGNEAQLLESGITVNGVLADRYAIDESNLDGTNTIGGGDVEIEEAHVAIAREGGYVVQVVVVGRGQGGLLADQDVGEARIAYELNFTPLDNPGLIEVPPACAGSDGAAGDFPIADDAYDISTFAGLTTYNTDRSIEDLIAFYKEAMSGNGWSIGQEFSGGDIATLQFSMNDRTVMVTITNDAASGARTVVIFEE